MDYSRPERADRLAAEYVAGTLRGRARNRFQSLLIAHPALRNAVTEWQDRLMPLAIGIEPVQPPARVWKRIEERIQPSSQASAAPASASDTTLGSLVEGVRRRLNVWRGIAGLATVAALGLAVVVANPPASQPPILVVLSSAASGTTPAMPSFIASVSGDGSTLVARPIVPVSMAADRALELWAVPQQGAPRSLGLVSSNGTTALSRNRVQPDVKALAVSVEPPGGSPTGAPTGPIIFTGALTS